MRPLLVLLIIALATVAACTDDGAGGDGGPGERTDASALADAYLDEVRAVIAQQEADGVPATPLGRRLEECLVADDAALSAIAAGLDIGDSTGEVLNATVQDPDGAAPAITCAVRFGEASAGAVVLNAAPSTEQPDALRARLRDAGFVEIDDATAEGLPDDEVLLFDATTFEASRAVWLADGFQVSLTANTDLASTGALLAALPVAVREVTRTVGVPEGAEADS